MHIGDRDAESIAKAIRREKWLVLIIIMGVAFSFVIFGVDRIIQYDKAGRESGVAMGDNGRTRSRKRRNR